MLRPYELLPDALGLPLACDLFDRYGVLLLAKGAQVNDPAQMLRLNQRKLFARAEDLGDVEVEELLSPFTAIAGVVTALQTVFDSEVGEGITPRVQRMADTLRGAMAADGDACLGWAALDRRAPYSLRHSVATALLCELMASQLGLGATEQRSVLCAALTMNVAMRALQDELAVTSAPLEPEHRAQILTHPERARGWLQARGVADEIWLTGVADHHELLDGRGYPRQLTAPALALPARLIALADIYCAKTSERFYRPPKLPSAAAREILRGRRSGVDPMLAGILFRMLGAHPAGTLARLVNGEVAVITHNAPGGAPVVVSVLTPQEEPMPQPTLRDTTRLATAIRSYITFDPRRHQFDLEQLWGYHA
jgi:HD-GYP domain-containing protein (c-di-GMP phosphodiesterase class II)